MQEARNAALARCRDDDFGALAIHRIEIGFVRYPHTRQAGKVIDLVDIAEHLLHQVRIQH